MPPIDKAGRQIAGLLTYNPGPGIYSRLERAIQAMPENVRAQELPGLLKRYKDGVPGWELKATDLDSVIAGRDVVPREELLGAVRERSPVYTHKEVVLGGTPPRRPAAPDGSEGDYDVPVQVFQGRQSPLGGGVSHGEPLYSNYGQGGADYSELLLAQPWPLLPEYNSHWASDTKNVVAHARYDTHGDALRINELQSDLGIHNRKIRESGGRGTAPPQLPTETDAAYLERISEAGWRGEWGEDGEMVIRGQQQLPFPLEDAWSDLLIKRMALEAARGGHRAIEVASPRAIADKVGGNIDNYEHFYGKVVPGALERLGRKMGGLTPDSPSTQPAPAYDVWRESEDLLQQYRRFHGGDPNLIDAFNDLLDAAGQPAAQRDAARTIYGIFGDEDPGYATARTREAMALADQTNAARAVRRRLEVMGVKPPRVRTADPGRRYLMSDEMRRRLIQEGVGAAVAGGIMSQDDLIERLGQ